MRPIYRPLVSLLLISAGLAACTVNQENPAQIDVSPTYPVRYATQRVSPAVVQLEVKNRSFVNGVSRPRIELGSGFIIDKEGHVLTNFHVAGLAERIDITLSNQEHVQATLVGSDHWTDLALVQMDMNEIKAKKLTFEVAQLGSSSSVALGQDVMAVGTPYGLSRTVTKGIISQTDRAFDETNIDNYETGWFNNWIQTDAAINPGNSGGPLINLKGEVIGINTRGINEGNNLGFAIPIDVAKDVYPQLLKNKKVTRSYVGLQLQPMQDFEKHYDVPGNKGVLISSVDKDSPAEYMGIQPEDVLLAVNDNPVNARFPEQIAAVRKLLADFPVGSKIQLTVQRGLTTTPAMVSAAIAADKPAPRNETKTIAVTTDRLESVVTEERAITAWDMTARDLTRAYLRDARLLAKDQPRIEGVLVLSVRVGSPAEHALIAPYDIIQTVDGKKVTSLQDLADAVSRWSKTPKMIEVDVLRGPRKALMQLSLKP